jgi:hypothetical protein
MIDRDVTRVQNTYVTNCCWYLTILDVAILNDLSGGDNLFIFYFFLRSISNFKTCRHCCNCKA